VENKWNSANGCKTGNEWYKANPDLSSRSLKNRQRLLMEVTVHYSTCSRYCAAHGPLFFQAPLMLWDGPLYAMANKIGVRILHRQWASPINQF
jgi:hypothetical protein